MIEGPIALRGPAQPFEELASLRDISGQILVRAVSSLREYRDAMSSGFFHVLDADAPDGNAAGDFSKASSATVVPFLVRTGRWAEANDGIDGKEAAQSLLDLVLIDRPWTSADLPGDNPFTVGFLLELVAALLDAEAELSAEQAQLCDKKLACLVTALTDGEGRISIEDEVANSYLTQLAMRVLRYWDRKGRTPGAPHLRPELATLVWSKALASVQTELALLHSDPQSADPFELGYATLLVNDVDRLRPETRRTLRYALSLFFEAQRPDGSWARSRRLFWYPKYGNAYCYEYEFLTQLLAAFPDGRGLVPYLAHLRRAVDRLPEEAVALPSGGIGWASGHHRQLTYPESWSTASCFEVVHQVDRLVADLVTDTLLADLGQTRLAVLAAPDPTALESMLDAPIHRVTGPVESAKTVIVDRFAKPISDQSASVRDGKPLGMTTRLSAIMYGPPGTSKTRYAKAISRYIGWDLISVDPSHLLRSGFANIQVEMTKLFRMLEYAERVVVFFDEIDELVRERAGETGEAESRFLTTSMLPRLGRLRESRRLVFLVATNHLEQFDTAIQRPGRFDLVIPIMPPTADAKLANWPDLATKLASFALKPAEEQVQRDRIEALTYDEFDAISGELAGAVDRHAFIERLESAWNSATINQTVAGLKWSELMELQKPKIRTGRGSDEPRA